MNDQRIFFEAPKLALKLACPRCGQSVTADQRNCFHCNEQLEVPRSYQDALLRKQVLDTKSDQTATDIRFDCPRCGQSLGRTVSNPEQRPLLREPSRARVESSQAISPSYDPAIGRGCKSTPGLWFFLLPLCPTRIRLDSVGDASA